MSIQEFWVAARPAQRCEALRLAGVPNDYCTALSYSEWADLSPLTVAALERAWNTPGVLA